MIIHIELLIGLGWISLGIILIWGGYKCFNYLFNNRCPIQEMSDGKFVKGLLACYGTLFGIALGVGSIAMGLGTFLLAIVETTT